MMIEARHLVKNFSSRRVLRGLDLVVNPGEIVALIGMNGAGKTTLMRILSTLSNPDAGRLLLNGIPVRENAVEVRRQIGAVLHAPMLYSNLTAAENLRFYCRLFDLPDADERIRTSLEAVNLAARGSDLVRTYSRGMQQRLAIARALIHQPRVLFMDEPYTGLDQASAVRLDGLMREFAHNGGAVLLATHDLERIFQAATRVDILHQGRIALSTPVSEETLAQLTEKYRQVTSATGAAGARA